MGFRLPVSIFVPLTSFLIAMPSVAEVANIADKESSGVDRYRLNNGLEIWHEPRPGSQSVAVLAVVNVGSRYESAENNGISHFVEHMVFTGTEDLSEQAIKRMITRRGGQWNAWTSYEQTVYYAHLAAQDLGIALEWLGQILTHPTFPKDKVDRERAVIFQEKWGRYGWLVNQLNHLGLGYNLNWHIRRTLFPDSSLNLQIIGEDQSLDAIDRAQLVDYHQAHYVPSNVTLIAVGNVESEQMIAQVQRHFSHWQADATPKLLEAPASPVTDSDRRIVVRGPEITNQVKLRVVAPTVGYHHEDYWSFEVLSELLRQVLMEEIRSRHGLIYSVQVYNFPFIDTGYFSIEARSQRRHWPKIADIIHHQLDQLQAGDLDDLRLDDAKAALQGKLALRLEDNFRRAAWLANWVNPTSKSSSIPDYSEAIAAVETADIARMTEAYLAADQRYLAMHLPVTTVASSFRWLGIISGVSLLFWLGKRGWRSRPK